MDRAKIRQMQAALMRAGAAMSPYFRRQESGEYERIGCILAIKYTPESRNRLTIDIPGVIMRAEDEHLEGIICPGTQAPREGDRVRTGGKLYAISAAAQTADGLYTLVLGASDE